MPTICSTSTGRWGCAMADRQTTFANALLDAAAPVPEGIIGPAGRPASKRFGVYRNNVVVGLVEALMATYPVVLKLVGEAFFRATAAIHVRQEPPTSPVLLYYGEGFPAFLDRFEPARTVPYLGDVARLEWAWTAAFHAADAAPLDPAALGAVAPDALATTTLTPHPALHIVRSAYPIVSIYEANRCTADPATADLPETGEDALVTRPDLDVEIRRLPPGGADFVATLANGEALGKAATAGAEAAARRGADFDLAGNLGGILEAGAFCALHQHQDPS